jgi:uncharacterized membrane protein
MNDSLIKIMVPKDLSAKRVKDKVLYLKLKQQDLLRLDHLTIVSFDDFDKKKSHKKK